MEPSLTPRQAITWAELVVAVIVWGFYGWYAVADAPAGVPLGGALIPSIPWLILAVGASLIVRVCVWIFARSPNLSGPGTDNYPGGVFGFRAYITGMTIREAFAILAGKRKGFGPFANEAEHAAWRSARPAALIAMAGFAVVSLVAVFAIQALGTPLWEGPVGRGTLALNLLATCILIGLFVHRALFLKRSPPPGA